MPDSALAPLTVSNLVLRSRRLEIDAVRHLADRAILVDVVGQLIEGLQRERGASGAYLASNAQRFAELRASVVQEVRALESKLREEFARHLEPEQGATAKALSLMAWVLLGLDSLPALRSQIVLGRIHRNPVQPGIKSTVAAESRQRPVRLEESLLGNVQSLIRVPHITHHQIDDLVLVLEHQQIESTLVALLDTADQLDIGGFSRHTATPEPRGPTCRHRHRQANRPEGYWKVLGSGCQSSALFR